VPLTERDVAGVLRLDVAGVRAADDDDADVPGVVLVVRDDDRFGLGEDTALVSDSKKDDILVIWSA